MDDSNREDDYSFSPWWEELEDINPLDLPDLTEMAELIIRSTEGITEGMFNRDDKIAMMAFLALLRDFTIALEQKYSGTESNNGTINIHLN